MNIQKLSLKDEVALKLLCSLIQAVPDEAMNTSVSAMTLLGGHTQSSKNKTREKFVDEAYLLAEEFLASVEEEMDSE